MDDEDKIVGQLITRKKGQVIFQIYDESVEAFKRYSLPEYVLEVNGSEVIMLPEIFNMAMTFGIEWESILNDVVITKDAIAQALYQSGVFEFKDLVENPNRLQSAALRAASPVMKSIVTLQKRLKQEVTSNG